MISFEGTLQGESSGWHFSGYSFVAIEKESLAFQGETDEEIWLCLNDNDNLLCFEVVI